MSRGKSRRKSRRKIESRFVKYIRRTYKNKLCAITLLTISIISTYILKDATILLFISIMAVPLLFTKENWITE